MCIFVFKNLRIRQSRFINTVAASTFGVLLIHANSDTMRQRLWKDVLNNAVWYHSPWIYLHTVASVVGFYVICTLIDMVRRRLFKKPFLDGWIESEKYI